MMIRHDRAASSKFNMKTFFIYGLGLFAALSFCNRPAWSQDVGNYVIVLYPDVEVGVGTKVTGTLGLGYALTIDDIQDDYIWVKATDSTGLQFEGWIDRDQVATPKKALTHFSQKIKQDPGVTHWYAARGLLLFRDFVKPNLAILNFSKGIRLSPKNPELYRQRSLVWMAMKKNMAASADHKQAIRLEAENNSNRDSHNILSGVLCWTPKTGQVVKV